MLTTVMAALGTLLTIFPGGGASLWPPAAKQIVVCRGQTVVIYDVRAYKTYPTCMSLPRVDVDAYPRPSLGAISTKPRSMKGVGPCGIGTYPLQTVTYTAGRTTGTERFQLYFYMTDGKRDQRAIDVIVR